MLMRSISATLAAATPIRAVPRSTHRRSAPEARLALFDAQHFRIVEPVAQGLREAAGIENHRRGDHRPGERPAPGFVDPADQPRAAPLDPEIRHPSPPRGLCHKGAGRATAMAAARRLASPGSRSFLMVVHALPAAAFDLFGTRHEVTVQFATADGKPLANAEVRVFAPGEPKVPAETGRTDAEGKFVFEADRDGFWSAEARSADQVAHLMIRVGGDAQPQSRFSPFLVIGVHRDHGRRRDLVSAAAGANPPARRARLTPS